MRSLGGDCRASSLWWRGRPSHGKCCLGWALARLMLGAEGVVQMAGGRPPRL